ncbi:hypothetical protein TL16_g11659 [Triparma laevis f. inornata]|uniref:ZZ-type domain-containing protein n=1 Tax=Triparma laevis f. inornata TaxID=1714386 RepID=A0A9W7BM10_9STRA|nr:hypothetical protein TL16_g11659 [Triparma laevis f. inornata]
MSASFLPVVKSGQWDQATILLLTLPRKDYNKTIITAAGIATQNPWPSLPFLKLCWRSLKGSSRRACAKQMKGMFHSGCSREMADFITEAIKKSEGIEEDLEEALSNLHASLDTYPLDGDSTEFEAAFERMCNDWGYSYSEFVNHCTSSSLTRHLVISATVYKDILNNDPIAVHFLEEEMKKDEVVEDLRTVLLPFEKKITGEGIERGSSDLSLSKSSSFQLSLMASPHPVLQNQYFKRLYTVSRNTILSLSRTDMQNSVKKGQMDYDYDNWSTSSIMALPELLDLLWKPEAGEFLSKVPFVGMALDMVELGNILLEEVKKSEDLKRAELGDSYQGTVAVPMLKSFCECRNCQDKRKNCEEKELNAVRDSFEISYLGYEDEIGSSCTCPDITLALKELQHDPSFITGDRIGAFKEVTIAMVSTISFVYERIDQLHTDFRGVEGDYTEHQIDARNQTDLIPKRESVTEKRVSMEKRQSKRQSHRQSMNMALARSSMVTQHGDNHEEEQERFRTESAVIVEGEGDSDFNSNLMGKRDTIDELIFFSKAPKHDSLEDEFIDEDEDHPQLDHKLQKKCKKGHSLTSFQTLKPNFYCDECQNPLPVGTTLYGCRQCDYDLCEGCVKPQRKLPRQSVLGRAANMFEEHLDTHHQEEGEKEMSRPSQNLGGFGGILEDDGVDFEEMEVDEEEEIDPEWLKAEVDKHRQAIHVARQILLIQHKEYASKQQVDEAKELVTLQGKITEQLRQKQALDQVPDWNERVIMPQFQLSVVRFLAKESINAAKARKRAKLGMWLISDLFAHIQDDLDFGIISEEEANEIEVVPFEHEFTQYDKAWKVEDVKEKETTSMLKKVQAMTYPELCRFYEFKKRALQIVERGEEVDVDLSNIHTIEDPQELLRQRKLEAERRKQELDRLAIDKLRKERKSRKQETEAKRLIQMAKDAAKLRETQREDFLKQQKEKKKKWIADMAYEKLRIAREKQEKQESANKMQQAQEIKAIQERVKRQEERQLEALEREEEKKREKEEKRKAKELFEQRHNEGLKRFDEKKKAELKEREEERNAVEEARLAQEAKDMKNQRAEIEKYEEETRRIQEMVSNGTYSGVKSKKKKKKKKKKKQPKKQEPEPTIMLGEGYGYVVGAILLAQEGGEVEEKKDDEDQVDEDTVDGENLDEGAESFDDYGEVEEEEWQGDEDKDYGEEEEGPDFNEVLNSMPEFMRTAFDEHNMEVLRAIEGGEYPEISNEDFWKWMDIAEDAGLIGEKNREPTVPTEVLVPQEEDEDWEDDETQDQQQEEEERKSVRFSESQNQVQDSGEGELYDEEYDEEEEEEDHLDGIQFAEDAIWREQNFQVLLYVFYTRHNPEKMNLIPSILEDFQENEEMLMKALLSKYDLGIEEWDEIAVELEEHPEKEKLLEKKVLKLIENAHENEEAYNQGRESKMEQRGVQ